MAAETFSEAEKILELDSRRRIFGIVRSHAGAHLREIGRIAGIPGGTVRYHLSFLTKHGLIKAVKDGKKVRYFPGMFRTGNRKLMALLRQKPIREIILTLLLHGSCGNERIARAVGLSPSTVSWHLKRLVEGGVVASGEGGRRVFYLLADKDEIIGLLVEYRESFLDTLVDRVIEMWE